MKLLATAAGLPEKKSADWPRTWACDIPGIPHRFLPLVPFEGGAQRSENNLRIRERTSDESGLQKETKKV